MIESNKNNLSNQIALNRKREKTSVNLRSLSKADKKLVEGLFALFSKWNAEEKNKKKCKLQKNSCEVRACSREKS